MLVHIAKIVIISVTTKRFRVFLSNFITFCGFKGYTFDIIYFMNKLHGSILGRGTGERLAPSSEQNCAR